MGILQGKAAVVTGASRGLGLAIAKAFAREGAAIAVCSRSARSVEQALESLRRSGATAIGLPCNVSQAQQVRALAARALDSFGRLDIWINNAGLSAPYGPTMAVSPEKFYEVVHTNILGAYHGSHAAMAHFLEQKRGKLINISGHGDRGPQPLQNAYASSKAWLRSFTMALAQEYKDSGVGVFLFSPGLVDTDMLRRIQAVEGYAGRAQALPTVMRMWANPPEIPARRAVWIASSATDGRTGLIVRQLGMGRLVSGLLKEGLRRITAQTPEPIEIETTLVPPYSPAPPKGSE